MSDYVFPVDFKNICEEFLYDVWNDWIMNNYNDINLENDDMDWWKDNFCDIVSNNWETDYDIVEWIDEDDKKDLFKCSTNIFDVIKYINSYYNNNYGDECIMDYNKLNEDFILRNSFYVYCQENWEDFIIKMKTKTINEYKEADKLLSDLCWN